MVARLRAAGCVFAEEEAALLLAATDDPDELASLIDRRVAGRPLEYLLGWAAFAGLRIVVEPGVFVPRRRSELLVSCALAGLSGERGILVDLCCGSGAAGAAVLAAAPHTDVYAADCDPVAVACAKRNLPPARVYLGDLFEPLPTRLRGRVDVLVANAPYVPSSEIAAMPPEARDHEHRQALDGGPDGLAVLRRVITGSVDWLAPGGRLIVEAGVAQAPVVVFLMGQAGLSARVESDDELYATAVIGLR